MLSRKHEEIEFHNQLRRDRPEQRWSPEGEQETAHDPLWANFKYYAIERKSLEYLRTWLSQHCVGRRVLDYGCGNGDESMFVAKRGARQVVGIDISEVAIENCRKQAVREGVERIAEFRVNDGEALDFEDSSFDIAMEYGVLHHVDLDAGVRELARVLKPDGMMICTEALGHNPAIRLYRKFTPHLRTRWEVDHILRRRDFLKIRQYFARIDMRFFHLATLAGVPFRRLPWFNVMLGSLEAIDAAVLRLPWLRWQAWEVVFVLSEPKKSGRIG